MALDQSGKAAVLYRMVMPDHLCPYGLKSKDLLEREGFTVEDHHLKTREETEAFKEEHGVDTTPQTFIDGERIGGYDDLREHFGQGGQGGGRDQLPAGHRDLLGRLPDGAGGQLVCVRHRLHGSGARMVHRHHHVPSGVQKLQDVESFSTMFLNYDLLARRWVRYGYVYPFGEALAGILMIAGALIWISAPVALFIGTVGAVSVFKAVYIDKRELKCACVGGSSNVPLGFVSLTENLMMMAMGIWMPVRMVWLG